MSPGQRRSKPVKPGLRPQVWQISPAEWSDLDKVDRPARICHVLDVAERGERGVAALAVAQRGVARVDQLIACGISRRGVSYRRQAGRFHPVFPRVLTIGNPELGPLGLEMAALLYAGENCALSHRKATVLWSIVAERPEEPVALTCIGRGFTNRPGLRCHRVTAIDLRDLRLHHGLPVTAPARSLIDLAGEATAAETADALNEARMLGLVTDEAIAAAIGRCPLRAGVRQLRAILADEHGRGYTRQELERRFRALIRTGQLPAPQFNAPLLGYVVDVLWARERVIVELDGAGPHARPRAFHADRRRDQRLAAAGYIVLRVTWQQLEQEPQAVLVRVAQTLAIAAMRLDPG